MIKRLSSFAVMVSFLVSACGFPIYKLPPDTPSAKINKKDDTGEWICINGKRFNLVADSSGYADIPAGSRLTIGSHYYRNNGSITIFCNPRSSIIPEPNQRYFKSLEVQGTSCISMIFKEDSTVRSGLALDSTFAQSAECSSK